jgi:hypothetical protein
MSPVKCSVCRYSPHFLFSLSSCFKRLKTTDEERNEIKINSWWISTWFCLRTHKLAIHGRCLWEKVRVLVDGTADHNGRVVTPAKARLWRALTARVVGLLRLTHD